MSWTRVTTDDHIAAYLQTLRNEPAHQTTARDIRTLISKGAEVWHWVEPDCEICFAMRVIGHSGLLVCSTGKGLSITGEYFVDTMARKYREIADADSVEKTVGRTAPNSPYKSVENARIFAAVPRVMWEYRKVSTRLTNRVVEFEYFRDRTRDHKTLDQSWPGVNKIVKHIADETV